MEETQLRLGPEYIVINFANYVRLGKSVPSKPKDTNSSLPRKPRI